VDLVNNQIVSMDAVADVLLSVRKKGVRLWSKNGQLYYKAPKGALTQEEIERLRLSRGQVVALLGRNVAEEAAELRLGPRQGLDPAPLAFSQLAHWNLYQLRERPGMRQVASAMRLHGRLKIDALRQSVAEIVRQHDALRTRIVVYQGIPTQEIAESGDPELKVDDLTALPQGFREGEVKRLIEKLILEPIDVAVGPLWGVRLLRLRNDEHVLIVAMEHIISDGVSLNILFRDLLTGYVQALRGQNLSLPEVRAQFIDYAVWQRKAQKSWLEKHGAYWNKRLAGSQRLRFPEDRSAPTETRFGWTTLPVRIESDLKAELRRWCRLRRTTIVMSVFAAYVALVLRWCNASECVIQYQSDGRVASEVENTIGFFASVLYLRIGLLEGDKFIDLINRVTEEYCVAFEHADFSYFAAQLPLPEFVRNSAFNWLPQGSKLATSDLDGSEDAITCSPVRFAHPMVRNLEIDSEPSILLSDTDDEIIGDVYFPLSRFSRDTMERFGRNFLEFIRALLRQPEERVKDIVLL
jgi:hypothetical protein